MKLALVLIASILMYWAGFPTWARMVLCAACMLWKWN